MTVTALLKQIHLGSKSLNRQLDGYDYAQEHERSEATLLGMCPAHLWYNDSYTAVCPRPILIEDHHQKQMEVLHKSLTAALVDIAQRWFSDEEARLPERMPLEPEEEELLRVRGLSLTFLTVLWLIYFAPGISGWRSRNQLEIWLHSKTTLAHGVQISSSRSTAALSQAHV